MADMDISTHVSPTECATAPVSSKQTAPVEPNSTEPQQPLEQLDHHENAPKARTKRRIAGILAALYLVIFITALDQTVTATSIPRISSDLGSALGYSWIGAAYLLGISASNTIWAKCSDIWGRKPALVGAILIFLVASIIAALSTSMPMLIAARALQGVAGGGLGGLAAITISDLFSIRERSLYLGLMGGIYAVAGSAGPLIGGAFTQYVSWRWCFWLNVPICGLSLVLLLLCLDVHNPRTKLLEGLKVIDWYGVATILAVSILLLLGLDFGGETFPWASATVICLLVFGALLIPVFLLVEYRLAKHPLIPLGIFQTWSGNAVFLVAFGHSMTSLGVEYYLPLYFQSVKQASPLRSGVLLLPLVLSAAAADVVFGLLVYRTGRYREFIWAGVTLMTLGTGLYIQFGVDTPTATVAGIQVIGGVGVALLFQTPTIAVQNTVTQADTASATAALSFVRGIASSLSIVIGGVVFQNSMSNRHSVLAASGLSNSTLNALSGDQAAANVHIVQTIQDESQRRVVEESFAWSLRNMFILYTSIAALTLLVSPFIKHKHMAEEHTETKTGIDNLTRREEKVEDHSQRVVP